MQIALSVNWRTKLCSRINVDVIIDISLASSVRIRWIASVSGQICVVSSFIFLFTYNWTWLVVEYLMRYGVGYILWYQRRQCTGDYVERFLELFVFFFVQCSLVSLFFSVGVHCVRCRSLMLQDVRIVLADFYASLNHGNVFYINAVKCEDGSWNASAATKPCFFACVRVCAFFDLVTFTKLVPGPGVEMCCTVLCQVTRLEKHSLILLISEVQQILKKTSVTWGVQTMLVVK